MAELIPINILVADRTYRIRTSPEHEESIRKTLKVINDKILEFKTQFAGKDMQDYIAMVVIWYATQANENNNSNPEIEKELISQIEKLEELVDRHL